MLSTFVINLLIHIYQNDNIAPEIAAKIASVNGSYTTLRLKWDGFSRKTTKLTIVTNNTN